MAATIDIIEAQALTGLRAYLAVLMVSGFEIIRAEVNRVPQPKGPNYIVITPLSRDRMSTNVAAYSDIIGNGKRLVQQSTRIKFQIDVYGPISADNAQIVSTMLFDQDASAFLANYALAPMEVSSPRQMSFSDSEQQVEFRWSIDASIQAHPIVSVAQDFADEINVTLKLVEATAQ